MDSDPQTHEAPPQPTKVCSKCHLPKPRTEFHRSSHRPDGLYSQCKQCISAYHKQRYANESPEQKQRRKEVENAWRNSPGGKAHKDSIKRALREKTAAERKLRSTERRPETYKYGAPVTALPEYNAWAWMKRRCYTPSAGGYAHYGGRGIKVCDRWRDSFENFLADMGPKPRPEHGLGRLDPNGDYTPENCRWMTKREQLGKRRQP